MVYSFEIDDDDNDNNAEVDEVEFLVLYCGIGKEDGSKEGRDRVRGVLEIRFFDNDDDGIVVPTTPVVEGK